MIANISTDSTTHLSEASCLGNDLLTGYRLGQRLRVRYGYEPVRAVLTQNVVERTTSAGAVVDTVYRQYLSWDDAGNVSGMRRHSGDSLSFGMDRLYQLRSVDYGDGGALRTDYDANGNRIRHDHPMDFGRADSFTYTANRVGTARTARYGTTVFRHDALGNLAVEANFANAADTGDVRKAWRVIERRWNKRSELERARVITRLDGTDTVNLRYEYGEDGNRVASLVAVGSDTTKWTVTHRWVYDGTSIVADSGIDHSWQWHAFQGLNRLAEIADTGALRVRYVVTDHQGSTQLLLTDTAGVLGKWVWDPWGNLEYARTDATTELLYQGKTYETKLGEWYFNARWYSPERGSFTGRDPKLQFWAPYSYVGNSPLINMDPTGLVAEAKKIGESKLFANPIDYINPAKWILALVGPITEDIFRIEDNGIGNVEVDNNADVIGFLPGMLNDYESAQKSGLMIAKSTGQPVIIVGNKSKGILSDAIEATITKLTGANTAAANGIASELSSMTGHGYPVLFMAHSQGGINLSEGLANLSISRRAQIDIMTFGAAAYFYPWTGGARHYASANWDPVSGVLGKYSFFADPNVDRCQCGAHPFEGYWKAISK